jgi:hypothetical protein
MWVFADVPCFLARNISHVLAVRSWRRKTDAERSWETSNCALPFWYVVNGWNHVTVASHVLNHCSCLVEDGLSREVANSTFSRMGDVTFSLAVPPSCPFRCRSPLVCSVTQGLARGNNQVLDALRPPVPLFLHGLSRYQNLIELCPMLVQPFAPWAKRPMGVYHS